MHQRFKAWFQCEHTNCNNQNPNKNQTMSAVKLSLLICARRWIYVQHWGIKAHYCCVNDTESGALDFLCYQPVTDGRGDPAAWPQQAEGRAATELFICLTPSQPVMELGGCCWCCWAGFNEKLCWGGGLNGGLDVWAGLIRVDPSRPKLTHASPSQCVTASPLVQQTLTASLVNSLVTANTDRCSRSLTGGNSGVAN